MSSSRSLVFYLLLILVLKQTSKRSFIRRTKSTANPDFVDTATTQAPSKYTRRGFKPRKEKIETTTEVARENGENGAKKNVQRPSLVGGGARSERPHNFVRRRPGGANVPSTTSSTTASPTNTSRRPFRVASRRRLPTTRTSTTTTTTELPETTTLVTISEEYLQDIGDTDVIEEPAFERSNRTKTQRRPLLLKEESVDQNPSATNDEERKRHSKKYSSSFKQNQLDEVLKQRGKLSSQEEVDTYSTTQAADATVDDFNPETALAIAAHQLLSAPLPTVINYDEEPKSKKSTKQTPTFEYKYTSPTYTDDYTETKLYEDISSTPIYKTPSNQDYVQTSIVYDAPTTFSNPSTSTFTPKTSTFTTRFTARVSKPASFTTSNVPRTLIQDQTTEFAKLPQNSFTSRSNRKHSRQQTTAGFSDIPSTAAFIVTSDKLIPVPVEDYSITTGAYSSIGQEPTYFTREYLMESPVTKAYDDEYQYLSPTTPQSTTRKLPKKIAYRKISTTLRPTISSYVPVVTTTPRRVPAKKPFEKVAVKGPAPNRYKPIENYDYYDDGAEKLVQKYAEGTKVVLHSKGTIECLDIGNFPHPTSCKKFISCARLENGSLLGWEYICPKGLSFDPVGGICNWSAGLGCDEKDV